MLQDIPKNPIYFGIYITKMHMKWATSSLVLVFLGSALSRFNVLILRFITDAIAAHPLVLQTVWMWAISYPAMFLISECIWRGSGFTGMHWVTNFRLSAYSSLYEYLTLHSKDYFNSRFSGSLTSKISNAVDGTEQLFENILWQFLPLGLGIVWYVIFSWFSNLWLGSIIAGWSVIFLSMNIWFAKKLQPRSFQYAEAVSTLKGRIVDSLSN